MKKILMKRGGGKTALLIKEAADHKYLIVANRPEVVYDYANSMGIDIRFPISYDQFLDGDYYEEDVGAFLIDDVEFLLKKLSTVPIRAVSMSMEFEDTISTVHAWEIPKLKNNNE